MKKLIFIILLFVVNTLYSQESKVTKLMVRDSITSLNRGDNLVLQGKGKGVVEVVDTLHVNTALEISGGDGEQVIIGEKSLLEVITRRVFEDSNFDGEGLVLVTTSDGKAKYTLMKVTTNSSPAILISANTELGDDTKSITLTPAGGFSNRADNRGPSISGYANQFVDANLMGALHYRAGNLPTGTHDFYTKGYRRFGIKQNGDIKAYGNNLLGIGGSPLSGTVGEYDGVVTHGGLDIIGNGLQETHIQFTRDDQVMTFGAKNSDHRKGSYVQVESIHVNDGTKQGGNLNLVVGDDGAGHVGDIHIPSLDDEGYLKMTGGVLGTVNKVSPYYSGNVKMNFYSNKGNVFTQGGNISTVGYENDIPIVGNLQVGDAILYGTIRFASPPFASVGVPQNLMVDVNGFVMASEAVAGEQGDKGDKGDQGDQGIQGIQGVKGNRGFPGADGTSFAKLKVSEGDNFVNLEIVPSAGDSPNNSIFKIVAGEFDANGAKLQLHGNDASFPGNAELHARGDGDTKLFAGGFERVITNKDGNFEVKDHLKLHTERDRRGNFIQKTAEIKGNLVLSNPNYAHAGKFLGVDGSGNVTAVDAPSGGGGGFENPYYSGNTATNIYTNGGNIISNGGNFSSVGGDFNSYSGDFNNFNGDFNTINGNFIDLGLAENPGQLYVTNQGVITNVNPSDERLKTVKGPYIGGLEIMVQMNPVNFVYNKTFGNDAVSVEQIGFLANEVNKFAPELTTEYDHQTGEHEEEKEVDNGDGTRSIRTVKVKETVKRLGFNQPMPSPITVNAIKELSALLKLQGELIASLEAKNREFETRITELEKSK